MARQDLLLFDEAIEVTVETVATRYDDERDVTVLEDTGQPLVLSKGRPPTSSKTLAAPADDDPDYESVACY